MLDGSALNEQSEGWHSRDAQAVMQALESDANRGLTSAQAGQRLARFGPNSLTAPSRRPPWLRFLLQFHNVLIYLMLAAACVTAWLEHWVDTGVLLAAVVVNACIGFIQEGKAEKNLDTIRQMLTLRATVVRDGERSDIAAELLVPGDVVVLASGDKVPADVRLISGKNPRVNESILTGESEVVEKSPAPVPLHAPLGDRSCMLFSGTLVASGQVLGVVVATGTKTELGRIGALLEQVEEVTTPLLRQMAQFSRWLALAIVIMAAATFAIGVMWRGHAPGDMFMMVVALAASAIPEGLPAIMTITLALGVSRMAARKAIIRQLPAVEALGAVTTICSDKTGTLTRNEMTVQRIVVASGVIEASGVGYAPEGSFHFAGSRIDAADHPDLGKIARIAVLCNDADLQRRGELWQITGDPTEGALVTLAAKAGVDAASERAAWPRLDAIPFESEHRLMATLHHGQGGIGFIAVKGAPERILELCDSQGENQRLDQDYWRRGATDLAARGLRVLALAHKRVDASQRHIGFADLDPRFTLLALVGIIDPPREEAMAAVAECTAAGIRVKMITGDHAETARAIGAQMGIGRGRPALTGPEI